VLAGRNMNGATDIKKAAINKAKQAAQAAAQNGNGGKKRRKGQDLKPIITTEQGKSQEASPASSANSYSFAYVLNRPVPSVCAFASLSSFC